MPKKAMSVCYADSKHSEPEAHTGYAVRVETLGCRLNQVESEAFASLCREAGFELYTSENRQLCAEVVLCFVNTCTVTGKAEQKARRLIRLLAKEHPSAVLLVTGCYAQLEAAAIEKLHPHVVAFPGQYKDKLTALPDSMAALLSDSTTERPLDNAARCDALKARIRQLQPQPETASYTPPTQPLFALSAVRFSFHSRGLIKIQDGCNNACAYCRIRLARGSAVSLPAEEVLRRILQMEKAGVPEVTLSGVNLSQYTSSAGDFAGLLAFLLARTRIRIRISSLYPDRIDDALLPQLAHPHICPHFHLSIQSGSNAVLRAMNRTYSRETIYRAVERLRSIKDNPFIGVDIITGFPGETDEDFEETYTLCKELQFTGIHAFPFSPRPGTQAWNMQPKVPERIAGMRARQLTLLAQEHAAAYYASWNGKTVYGVTEEGRDGTVSVTTENYLSLRLSETDTPLHGGCTVLLRVCGDKAEIISRNSDVQ